MPHRSTLLGRGSGTPNLFSRQPLRRLSGKKCRMGAGIRLAMPEPPPNVGIAHGGEDIASSKVRRGGTEANPSALPLSKTPRVPVVMPSAPNFFQRPLHPADDPAGFALFQFVFPEADDAPARAPQGACHERIAPFVRAEFLPPEHGVVLRLRPVLGTTMPETTVHEHCEPRLL